jgi:hypothetical protein
VTVTETADGVELWFPPFRATGTAVLLALFGLIATAIGGIGVAAVVPGAATHAGGLMSAMLIAGFILPFVAFGVVFVAIAAYAACNALLVRIDASGVRTWRMLFGIAVAKHAIAANEISAVEPQIVSRDQTPFGAEPVYRLIALTANRTRRIIVAESLKGENEMERVKELIVRRVGVAHEEGKP